MGSTSANQSAIVCRSGEDLDPLQGGSREGGSAFRTGVAVSGGSLVAIRAWLSRRPTTREQEPDKAGQSRQPYDERPGILLAA